MTHAIVRRRAAMLDRDGTIVADTQYLRDPSAVRLLPGASEALRRLAAAGMPAIVCTNQSGIARGIISLAAYRAVRLQTEALLDAEGAALLDSFVCPHHPDITGPCRCRKPDTLLYERAADVHRLDLAHSVFIGDKYRDVAPATRFGGRGFLIRWEETPADDVARAEHDGHVVVSSLLEAVVRLLDHSS